MALITFKAFLSDH